MEPWPILDPEALAALAWGSSRTLARLGPEVLAWGSSRTLALQRQRAAERASRRTLVVATEPSSMRVLAPRRAALALVLRPLVAAAADDHHPSRQRQAREVEAVAAQEARQRALDVA